MSIISIVLIAVGLAMDAFAVSIAGGVKTRTLRLTYALRIAALFGGFQALMPVIGWAAGLHFRTVITGIDHWIAFGLLSLIGLKMIYESFRLKTYERKVSQLNILVLLILSVATSIDALAVGLSLSFLKVSIALPAVIIGAITFVLSFFGVFIGNKTGHFFERKIEMAGGLILIGIGMKILIEHLT